MYKVFYFLPIILLTLVFLIIKTELVYAVNQSNFKVIQIPNPFSIDKRDISITVSTEDGSNYFVEPNYSFAAWKGTLNKDASCTFNNFSGMVSVPLKKVNPTTVIASWRIVPGICGFIGDQWYFRLWRGEGWDAMNNPDNIIKEYSFIIAQSGGQVVTITAKNPCADGTSGCVYSGEQPIVILSNTTPNTDYTFWWKDEQTAIAAYYSRDKNPNNPLEVDIPFGNFNYNQPSRKLCMEYGNFRLPPGGNNSCNIPGKNVLFKFINEKRPTPTNPIKCTILPTNSLPLNSKVDIRIENVPSNTIVFAYAKNNDTNQQWSTAQGISDSTYTVALTIADKATEGSYAAAAYTENDRGTNICSNLPNPAFTVSSNPAPPVPSATVCTGENCTKGGGDTCNDGRGPAMKTAIGCIHTNPSELVKDLMTFIIGIGGGLAFLMMLFGAFQMLTSAGNPETLNAGRSRLTSAVIGLLFVIFAVLLMQIIGFDILKLPGFGR